MSLSPFHDSYWCLPPYRYRPAPKVASKSWDTLRKQDCNAGKIQSGEWSVDNGPCLTPSTIGADFMEQFQGPYVKLEVKSKTVGFSACGLDQLAEFCTVLAKQLRDCC